MDRDRTKTAEDRRVALCPRAVAVLERQLQLRERLMRAGRLKHAHLFFHGNGEAIRDLRTVYPRWRRTLRRLGLRYRKPYTAHHSSVSWDLMLGRNPLFVAKQQGHSVLTMLSVYAAWTRDTQEAEVVSIQRAMQAVRLRVAQGGDGSHGGRCHGNAAGGGIHCRQGQRVVEVLDREGHPGGSNWAIAACDGGKNRIFTGGYVGGADGTRTRANSNEINKLLMDNGVKSPRIP